MTVDNHEPSQEELDKAIQDVILADKMRQAVEIASLFVDLDDHQRVEFGDFIVNLPNEGTEDDTV